MKFFYHGSAVPGIAKIEARSKLHHEDQNVVYLTDCIPYALFYIWDAEHNGYRGKHVTGWIKNGVAYYEEQFPEQLRVFYQGVSGYLYCVPDTPDIQPVEGRENLFYCPHAIAVSNTLLIDDVYSELLKYEAEGAFAVLRYNHQTAQRQQELINMIASVIIHENFFEEDEEHRTFMKNHFNQAWKVAERNAKNPPYG